MVLVATGLAYGFWTVLGTGQGSDKATSSLSLTITAALSPTADLFPGGSGALQFTVTNPNPFGVSLTSLSTTTVTSSDPTELPGHERDGDGRSDRHHCNQRGGQCHVAGPVDTRGGRHGDHGPQRLPGGHVHGVGHPQW